MALNTSTNTMIQIELSNVTFGYEELPVITDVSFAAEQNTHLVIEGPSGRGKSTILKLLLGFYTPDEGSIHISRNGTTLTPKALRHYTAWLPQDLDLGEGTVEQVIRFPFGFATNSGSQLTDRNISDALDRLNLDPGLLGKRYRDLSTGQRQRVGAVIVFLLDKPVILLDEPTSALDRQSKQLMAGLLLEDQQSLVISTSHDPWWVNYATQTLTV